MWFIPKKEAKGSWPPKKSLNTSSGLRNVKVNPGKSDEKSELQEPEKWKCEREVINHRKRKRRKEQKRSDKK